MTDLAPVVMQREYDGLALDGAKPRAIVLEAPTLSAIAPAVLDAILAGTTIDSRHEAGVLVLGVDGRGAGVVRYRIGAYDPAIDAYLLTREDPPA